MRCVKTEELFDLLHSLAGEYLKNTAYPHEALSEIGSMDTDLFSTSQTSSLDA